MTKNYNAESIEVLEGLEPVRKRPGMYIGGTEGPDGLHHLVKEILDNSIDEAMNGHASLITVILDKECKFVSVEDNGRGIPVDVHPKFKKSALELILTTLHAGGKFGDSSYTSAGGLHGVGASVVNALSEVLEATVWRDGAEWKQTFSQGKSTSKIQKIGSSKKRGTKILFAADPEIFRATKFSAAYIEKIIKIKAFLNKGVKFAFTNEASGTTAHYCYEDGVQSYIKQLLEEDKAEPLTGEIFSLEKTDGIKVDISFCWTEETAEKIFSYVNGIYTAQGGSHEDGFRNGLSKALRNYISVHNLLPKGVKLEASDIREGLIAVVSVNVPGNIAQLQFQGQTKEKLNNPEVTAPVENLIKTFENTLNGNPNIAKAIVERILLASKARAASRQASQNVSRKIGVTHKLNLPGKLSDCSSTNPDKSELFIVEGDSAGGSAKQGRDRNTQAILPLRGKIVNTVAGAMSKLTENKELLDLVSAIGCGMGDGMKLDKLRYGKVVILTDADADGMHIATLLMAFFFRFMRPLVEGGHLYLGLPPLYRIKVGSGSKEEISWVYSDEEKEATLKLKKGRANIHITRFKGLGEMNPSALWETTLSPKTRNLLRVKIEDAKAATAMFESLLGKETGDRYDMIREHADRLIVDV